MRILEQLKPKLIVTNNLVFEFNISLIEHISRAFELHFSI